MTVTGAVQLSVSLVPRGEIPAEVDLRGELAVRKSVVVYSEFLKEKKILTRTAV